MPYKDKEKQRLAQRERTRRYRARVKLGLTSVWQPSRNREPRISKGYKYIWISPESPFSAMADAYGYVLEHRLAMALHLDRVLKPSEIIHHINKDKLDNCLDNLYLTNAQDHHSLTLLENRVNYLEKQIALLRRSNNAFERV